MNDIKLKYILEELHFFNIFKRKNKWMELLRTDREKLKKELYVLIDNAYAPLGGHVRISNINDVLDPVLTYWEAIDDDNGPEADAVLFGKKTKFGIKISGFGHDGTARSKSDLIKKMVSQFHKNGYWIEVSDRPAEILLGQGVPYVNSQEKVEELFNQKVDWLNDGGWYIRKIDNTGAKSKEIVIGKPI